VTGYGDIHDQLLDRALDSARRIEQLEADFAHQCRLLGAEGAGSARSPELAKLIDGERAELARVRGGLKRIASGDFGRCQGCGCEISEARLAIDPLGDHCPECLPVPASGAVSRIHAEHLGIRALLTTLEEVLRAAGREAGNGTLAAERAAAIALMADLERELQGHFAREEEGGYLLEALSVAPRHGRTAERLRGQHAEFGHALAQLVEQARASGGSAVAWRETAKSFGGFAEVLRDHERSENEIIADAFLDDLGGGG
jgi:DnaK suppressor protein